MRLNFFSRRKTSGVPKSKIHETLFLTETRETYRGVVHLQVFTESSISQPEVSAPSSLRTAATPRSSAQLSQQQCGCGKELDAPGKETESSASFSHEFTGTVCQRNLPHPPPVMSKTPSRQVNFGHTASERGTRIHIPDNKR